jgi:hypothetical protein
MAHIFGSRRRGPQQRRKNPPPTVREAQGEGVVLLAHGEPHDACPVDGCAGTLRFVHR